MIDFGAGALPSGVHVSCGPSPTPTPEPDAVVDAESDPDPERGAHAVTDAHERPHLITHRPRRPALT